MPIITTPPIAIAPNIVSNTRLQSGRDNESNLLQSAPKTVTAIALLNNKVNEASKFKRK